MVKDYFYKNSLGQLDGPHSVHFISEKFINQIKHKLPECQDIDLQYKKGKKVIVLTNFGELKTRHKAIQLLQQSGLVNNPLVKRRGMFDKATATNIFYKSGQSLVPVQFRLDCGTGAARSGNKYEEEVRDNLNYYFQKNNKTEYVAYKLGGSSANPDVVVKKNGTTYTVFETKSSKGADFGQFQIEYVNNSFGQKTQTDSTNMIKTFELIKEDLNKNCSSCYNPNASKELRKTNVSNLSTIAEDYYKEKAVDYIIVNDVIYTTRNEIHNIKSFKTSVSSGYVRTRVKNHGRGKYSTTSALRFRSFEKSENYVDVLEKLFP